MSENLNKKKKILFLITKSNWGGAQRYVYDLSTNLPKDKFESVVVLGGDGFLKDKLENISVRTISLLGLERDINLFKDFKIFFKLIKIFKKEKPDIIHVNSAKMGGLGALAGRLVSVSKIIFTAHGWAFNENRSWFSRLIIKFLSFLTIFLSHKTIAVSNKIKKEAPGLFLVKNKILIIHNSIKPISFEEKDYARKSLGNFGSSETIWLGTISELHKSKGLIYSIKAMEILKKMNPNFVFIVIGEGDERSSLEFLIKENKLENNVFLVGHKDNAASLLKAFDIFILSSTTEALGYVLLEAGLAELPVVASKVGGIPEVIRDLDTGMLVRSKDSKEITNAIIFLLKNKDKARVFGENLKRRVENEFSLNNMILDSVSVYEK